MPRRTTTAASATPSKAPRAASKAGDPGPLIRRYATYDSTHLTDFLQIIAANVEDALISSGATPGVDYSLRDIFEWAMPVFLDIFRDPDSRHGKEFYLNFPNGR